MIEENWLDAICYSIYFKSLDGRTFLRAVAVPCDFLEDDLKTFFYNHFKQESLEIISIDEISDIWLSKKNYEEFINC